MGGMVPDASERLKVLQANAAPMKYTPSLRTFNMIGNVAGAMIKDPELGGAYLRSFWFMLVGIPIRMIGIYLVSHPVDSKGRLEQTKFYFHQKVTLRGVREAYGDGAVGRMVRSSALKYFGTLLSVVAVFAVLGLAGAYCSRQS